MGNLLRCKYEAYSVEEEYMYIIQFFDSSHKTYEPVIKPGEKTIKLKPAYIFAVLLSSSNPVFSYLLHNLLNIS